MADLMDFGVTEVGDGTWRAEGTYVDSADQSVVVLDVRGDNAVVFPFPDLGEPNRTHDAVFALASTLMAQRLDAATLALTGLFGTG